MSDSSHGICKLSVVPVRSEPRDQSEMVTQILFGEILEVLMTEGKWTKVKLAYDNYEGWIDTQQYQPIDKDYYNDLEKAKPPIAMDMVQPVVNSDHNIPILAGSSLPGFDGINLRIGKKKYVYNGKVANPEVLDVTGELVVKFARRFLHTPYLWGGRSPFGMDCSGFTQVVFKLCGIALPRDAYQQAEVGKTIDFVEQAAPGDLPYFANDEGRITHVGIITSPGTIIHASGWVKENQLDQFGIRSSDKENYSHKLKLIKRIL